MALPTPPVLLIAFNRPDTAARVFEAIRAARPARFFFACDGPRPGRPEEEERVSEVRRLVAQVDWPCDCRVLFQAENLGCGRGVSAAIDWFLREAGEGIILEDDCLPSPAFFPFAAAMLERHRNDPRIGLIAGTNMVPDVALPEDYGFSRIVTTWGWATWRRTWDEYRLIPEMVRADEPWLRLFGGRTFRILERSFLRIQAGDVHTWDFQLLVQMLRSKRLTVIPRRNLVLNIGFAGGGTHYKGSVRPWWAPAHAYDFAGDWTKLVKVEPAVLYDAKLAASCHGGTNRWARAWMKLLRKIYDFRTRPAADLWLSD